MMNYKLTPIPAPAKKERKALRLMILVGVISVAFFLLNMFRPSLVSSFPLYVLLMITMVYYCLKYLHEWYHYYSIAVPPVKVTTKQYTVDILTTYCAGEPFDMLEQTLTAIQQITYPHLAWCCDEADDPQVRKLCERLGVQHVTRIIKKDAKAGNINNALQQATGELCVVLDPDHIPAPEFLDKIVAYFDDAQLGFVQVVQAYYNQSESLVAKGAAQQTYQFYGPMMMGMHQYGTVQAIGANCTFRRAALDSIGGHASGLSEDMHTAMQLHAKGWTSIYLPQIVTRGLVPATMSSYFKQQLKWSRGTWELLLVTFPKLFSSFTSRQKLHYFTLPFHYLSGFIFLINFLIPVIALFTGYIPLKMDVLVFLMAFLPMQVMSILIRHYVQKWVAEETERGFHLVGGILQIGTWWIHSIGFVYTLLRKKIPYIPTPKNDNDPLPLALSIPNIMVILVSLAAIVYGAVHDYNPYTAFMIVLASMQVIFMTFILCISGYVPAKSRLNNFADNIKARTWLIIRTHNFLRRYSLPLAIVLVLTSIFAFAKQHALPEFLPKPLANLQVFYRGLQLPGGDSSSITNINKQPGKNDIALFALDMPFTNSENMVLDTTVLNSIYNRGSIPVLTWNLQLQALPVTKDTAALRGILDGKYDALINSVAKQLAGLDKPLFLSFDKRSALLNITDGSSVQFIQAWQYLHNKFTNIGAHKVIWVWTPSSPTTVDDHFPGTGYVDWIGVDTREVSNQTTSFDSMYRRYHNSLVFKQGLPVLVMQQNISAVTNREWWNTTWATIDTGFTEIRSIVIDSKPAQSLPWNNVFEAAPDTAMPVRLQPTMIPARSAITGTYQLPAIKAVLYNKGFFWFRNRHTMDLKTIEQDVANMKSIGINTIERDMPGFYDHNINNVLVSNNINLVPRFWLPATAEDIVSKKKLNDLKDKIIQVITENRNKENVIAWSLGEDVLSRLSNTIYKPDYFYYEQQYLSWLADICATIRTMDSVRPIIMDLHLDGSTTERYRMYKKYVPQLNTYMLQAEVKYKTSLQLPLEKDMRWGKVDVELWPLIPSLATSGMIPAWQDLENTDYITLDGLLDMQGRRKAQYADVAHTWTGKTFIRSGIPDIKILKPAEITRENRNLQYSLLYKEHTQWKFFEKQSPFQLEWYLVRVDQYGNTMFIKETGKGNTLHLAIPMEPQYYRLYVEAAIGDDVKVINTSLNTPLQ